MKISAYIPARIGSNRIAAKNVRLLNGIPLVAYAINVLKKCSVFDSVFVNTDSHEIGRIASDYGIPSYVRRKDLATSATSTDEIVYDFLKNVDCDAVAVINPTAPFLKPETVEAAVREFNLKRPSSLFSVSSVRRHSLFKGAWVNVDPAKKSPRTQDLDPVFYVNFVIAIFDAVQAVRRFEECGSFLYAGDVRFYEIPEGEAFDIDYEHEFRLAEAMMVLADNEASFFPKYYGSFDPTENHKN